MNTTSVPANDPTPIVRPNVSVIAVAATDEVEKRACGRITMWSLSGDVTVDALAAALKANGSKAIPPEAPSGLVALHRAVDAVAKSLGRLDVHHKGRGEWAIVSKPTEADVLGKPTLLYAIECNAKIVREGDTEHLEISGQGEEQIRAAYNVAKGVLAPSDIGTWLCDKLVRLGGIALRDSGGVYFLPKQSTPTWDRLRAGLTACSKHRVHTIPAMRSEDAIDAILSAVVADTQAACAKIASDIADGDLGDRGLKNREKLTAELVERLAMYENLLGKRLDGLRAAIDETNMAIATAKLAAASDE